jgi:hypothetical protein
VSIVKSGISALGKLVVVICLLGAFAVGMAGVVYMSLTGEEISVPDITGKDFLESEKELASLGLKIKRRADRPSTEKMNTVLEQLPKAGETVKTGQLIFVVVSKAGVEGEETPKALPKDLESDDTKKIEEMISDKPKKSKSNSNSNAKKKAETTRDVIANESNSNSDDDADPKADETNKKDPGTVTSPAEKGNKNTAPGPAAKPQNTPPKPTTGNPRARQQPNQ